MRNPERIPEILGLIEKIWLKMPDQRFGQLLENLSASYGLFQYIPSGRPYQKMVIMWGQEDDITEMLLKNILDRIENDKFCGEEP